MVMVMVVMAMLMPMLMPILMLMLMLVRMLMLVLRAFDRGVDDILNQRVVHSCQACIGPRLGLGSISCPEFDKFPASLHLNPCSSFTFLAALVLLNIDLSDCV